MITEWAILLFVITCVLNILVLLIQLFNQLRRQRRPSYLPPPTKQNKFKQRKWFSGVSSDLESRLVFLVGNRASAYRLVDSLKRSNPHRSEKWCYEKAIRDLERDRRA